MPLETTENYMLRKNNLFAMDAGGILYCSNPDASCEAIAKQLGIAMTGQTYYAPELLLSYSIYKLNDSYVVEQNYIRFVDIELKEVKNTEGFEKSFTLNEYSRTQTTVSSHSYDNYFASYRSLKDNQQFSSSSGVADGEPREMGGNPGSIWRAATMSVYNQWGDKFGFVRGTIYKNDFGYGDVNDTRGYLFSMVASVKAYPESYTAVGEYACTINEYIDGHMILDTATLPSGVNVTKTLSLSGMLSNTSYGGSMEHTTSWTYNPESQIIIESSSNPRIIKWTAKPASTILGKAFDITPNALIFVAPGYTGQRGSFIELSCPILDRWGNVLHPNTLLIGGWF